MANEIVNTLFVNDNVVEAAALRTEKFHDLLMDNKRRLLMSRGKERKDIFRERNEILKKASEELKIFDGKGLSPQNVGFRMSSHMNEDIPSSIRASLSSQVKRNFSSDLEGVRKGDRSIRSYKNGMPVPFSKKDIRTLTQTNEREFTFKFMEKHLPSCLMVTKLGRDRSNNAAILQEILNGSYQLCDSSFKFDGTKLFFMLVVKLPVEKKQLDVNKVLGVDIGVKCMMYYSDKQGLIRGKIGGDGELQLARRRISAQRRSLQERLIHARGGRGRKHKLAPLEKLEKQEKNFASTFNHTYAKQLIDVCLKNGFGRVIIEDLKGLSGRLDGTMLKHWSYYDLQTKIEQKANKYGIIVERANPKYTSQTCSTCGHCDKENRKTRDVFSCINEKCTKFGKKMDADLNAAINLANGMGLKVKEEELEF